MKKRVFIIHGWGGSPNSEWLPWLKKELEKKGFEVFVPAMPNTEEPKIEEWVPFLADLVGEPNENTYFVGGSIGCQTIMRYLETLPKNKRAGRVIFVAGWFDLTDFICEEIPEDKEECRKIARPWIETPINFKKVRNSANDFIAIFSDNDPYVELNNKDIFEKQLGAKIIIEHNKGHFNDDYNIKELPVVLDSILK